MLTEEAEMASDHPPSPPLSLLGSTFPSLLLRRESSLETLTRAIAVFNPATRTLSIFHGPPPDLGYLLEEYVAGDEAREMPCQHRFYSGCIEKWLSMHGICRVCGFPMPPEADAKVPREGGEDRGRSQISIVLMLMINGRDVSITGSGHGSTGHERSPGSDDSGRVDSSPARGTDS